MGTVALCGRVAVTIFTDMSAENHFYSPRELLADGRDETHRLNTAVGEFFARTARFHIPRFDLEERVYVHKVQFGEALPPHFAVSVRKIAGSLRSALDHAVNASKASLGSANLNSAFPFGGDLKGFELDIKRKCHGVAPEIISVIRGFQPYRGGNEDLLALNKLRNINEHRLLIAPTLAGGMTFPFEIAGKRINILVTQPKNEPQWDDVNKTLTFKVHPFVEHNPMFEKIEKKLTFFLKFGDIEELAGAHLGLVRK